MVGAIVSRSAHVRPRSQRHSLTLSRTPNHVIICGVSRLAVSDVAWGWGKGDEGGTNKKS